MPMPPIPMQHGARYDDPALCAANEAGHLTPDQRRQLQGTYRFAVVGVIGYLAVAAFIVFALVIILPAITALFGALFGLRATSIPITLNNGASFSIPCSGGLILIIAVVIGLFFMRPFVASVLRRYRATAEILAALSDLSQSRVAAAEGEIVWRSGAYHAQIGSLAAADRRDLRVARGASRAFPPPGPYRLFYLPSAHVLLSARPLVPVQDAVQEAIQDAVGPTGQGHQDAHSLQAALDQVLSVAPGDLAANQQGSLSPAQTVRLRRRAAKESLLAVALGLALVVGSLAYLAGVFGHGDVEVALLFFGFGVLIFLAVLHSRTQLLRDVAEGRVSMIEGIVSPREESSSSDGGTSYSYWYEVYSAPGGTMAFPTHPLHFPHPTVRFSVSAAAYHALIREQVYRAYYLHRSRTLLTIEPLAGVVPTMSPPPYADRLAEIARQRGIPLPPVWEPPQQPGSR